MKIFVLSDLHLGRDMSEFGEIWADHDEKIEKNWRASVGSEDLVLIPGDICWSRKLEEAIPHLDFIGSLPGTKFMSQGNHDWWWRSFNKIKTSVNESIIPINCQYPVVCKGVLIAGEKGSLVTGDKYFTAEGHQKSYIKNFPKVKYAVDYLQEFKKEYPAEIKVTIFMLHYPPCNWDGKHNEYLDAIVEAEIIDYLVYGHLHTEEEWDNAIQGLHKDINFILGSADYLDFKPKLILEI